MGEIILSFSCGDVVIGRVVEALDGLDVIVSFQGDLLRVSNLTGRTLVPGARVTLEVAAVNPLRFRLSGGRARSPRGRFTVRA